jgi:hypothetical protein
MAKYLGIMQSFGEAPRGDVVFFEANTEKELEHFWEDHMSELNCVLELNEDIKKKLRAVI